MRWPLFELLSRKQGELPGGKIFIFSQNKYMFIWLWSTSQFVSQSDEQMLLCESIDTEH